MACPIWSLCAAIVHFPCGTIVPLGLAVIWCTLSPLLGLTSLSRVLISGTGGAALNVAPIVACPIWSLRAALIRRSSVVPGGQAVTSRALTPLPCLTSRSRVLISGTGSAAFQVAPVVACPIWSLRAALVRRTVVCPVGLAVTNGIGVGDGESSENTDKER